MKRLCAWAVMVLELAGILLALYFWNLAMIAVLGWAEKALPEKVASFLTGNTLIDDGLLGLLNMALVYGLWRFLFTTCQRICPSRKGVRYLVLAVLAVLLGGFGFYCLVRGEIPIRLPYTVDALALFAASLGLAVNGIIMIKEVIKMWKLNKKDGGKAICVFCYQSRPQDPPVPFAYVVGGPGLTNRICRGTEEAPTRPGFRFDRELFMRMKRAVLDEAFAGSPLLDRPLAAMAGMVSEDDKRANFLDVVYVDYAADTCRYADIFAIPSQKGRGISYDMAEIRKGARRVAVDFGAPVQFAPAKPAAQKTAAEEPLPRGREALAEAVGDFRGTEIFAACRQLGIRLENVFDVDKLDEAALTALLKKLRSNRG